MQKLLKEWREYLAEQTFEEVDTLRKRIFAANGDIKLSNNQLGQLTRYVDLQQAEDPLGAALIAAAIKVYYRAKEDNWSNRAIVKKYAKLEKHLKGLTPQAGRSPTVRAIDAFLGAGGVGKIDPVTEKGLQASPSSPVFAKAIIKVSTSFKSAFGINILDPTMASRPPKWASKDPIKYAAWQTAADIFVKTPFDALLWLWGPAAGVGKKYKSLQNLARAVAGPASRKVAKNINKTGVAIINGDVEAATSNAAAVAEAAVNAGGAIKNMPPEQGGAAIFLDTWDGIVHNERRFNDWYHQSYRHGYAGIRDGAAKAASDAKNLRPLAERMADFQKYKDLEPLERWVAMESDLYDLMKKYHTRIEPPKMHPGDLDRGWQAGVVLMTDSPEFHKQLLWAMERGIPIKVPVQHITPGIEYGHRLLAPRGLKKIGLRKRGVLGIVAHEAGHIEFIRNYPVVSETFLKEWLTTLDVAIEKITERIAYRVRLMDAKVAVKPAARTAQKTAAEIAQEQQHIWVEPLAPQKFVPKKKSSTRAGRHVGRGPSSAPTYGRALDAHLLGLMSRGYHHPSVKGRLSARAVPQRKVSRAQWDESVGHYRRRVRESLKKHNVDVRVVSDSFNLYIMEGYKKIIKQGMRDPLWFITTGKYELKNFYEALILSKREYFRASKGDIYYLHPEEAFAELFSKVSRWFRSERSIRKPASVEPGAYAPRGLVHRKGDWRYRYDFQSKAFPETGKLINKIVKKEVTPHIKENIYWLKYKIQ